MPPLAGAGAAFCMVSKYWSIVLLAGLVVAALSDARRAAYFRSAAPWITVVTAIAVLSPHLGWLEKHDFSPVDYAMLVHGGHTVGDAVWPIFVTSSMRQPMWRRRSPSCCWRRARI